MKECSIHKYLQNERKDFNSTFFKLEELDVVMIQPNLIRYVPDEYVNPIEKAYFSVNGFSSNESFADTPVEANWGLFSIGYHLIRNNYRVALLDYNLYDYVKRVNTNKNITIGDIADSLRTKKAMVFAISCMTASMNIGIQIAKLIKIIHPDAYIVLGGIHPTLYAEDILKKNIGIVDFVIKGEGEISFVNFMNHLMKSNNPCEWPPIPGICYMSKNGVVINHPLPLNLETEDSILDFDFWPSDIPFIPRINLSRGCVGNCSYCSANRFFNGTYRIRTLENIIFDIKNSVINGYRKILFGDLSFGCHKKIATDICQYIIKNEIDIEWWCQMRLVDCDSVLLKLMSQAGCKQIALGFESAEPGILTTMSAKKDNKRDLFDICKEINDYGMALQGYFILGLPDETFESALKTIKHMELLLPYNMSYVHISICVPFPGTDLFENPEKYNIEIVDSDFANYLMNTDFGGTTLPVFNGTYLSRYQVYALWLLALATAEKHLVKQKRSILDNEYENISCERFYPHQQHLRLAS